MPWIFRGLRDGVLTTRYPRRPDPYADDGVESLARPLPGAEWEPGLDGLCPTGAITGDADSMVRLDQGGCVGCGACVLARPDTFAWQHGSRQSRVDRAGLIVPEVPGTDEELARLRAELGQRTKALRRSVHIRHVDAGSDGSEEWEILALLNPVYDVHRLGIFFTASPRHADILLVTGAGTHGMAAPLARTLEGTPRPLVVIAAGTDAVSGGLVAPSYATSNGIGSLVPVDVWVPGSPPSPFALLHAILLATGRLR
ncbi:NADH:ubiquinone oxidoreductase [Amycolatopsis sp. GM8]|uniref:NADH-quinone oxidoreductase subunit B family protein n=1 Tax=Amycolatopsis sp. GM8 TaxID=2896530 RepID=UPI001F1CA688|nr:NADH:ubiquinone oxidoreductase [Amycolatopsis sp. GM8]